MMGTSAGLVAELAARLAHFLAICEHVQMPPFAKNFASLGYRSQLIFTDFDGRADDRGNHWAIHTLSNPNYFWGNLLVFDRPPRRGDFAIWTELFRKEFTNPDIYHVTLAWDSPAGGAGDVEEFLENGFRLEGNAVLSTSEVIKPLKFNEELEVRIISGKEEWERMIQIQMASAHDHLSLAEWESFYRKQCERYQAMERAGFGHWYGGFLRASLSRGWGYFIDEASADFKPSARIPRFSEEDFAKHLFTRLPSRCLPLARLTNWSCAQIPTITP